MQEISLTGPFVTRESLLRRLSHRRRRWWIVLPVGVVVVLALASLLLTCLRRGGCCGGAKRSRPIVGASHPPAYGGGYPNQARALFTLLIPDSPLVCLPTAAAALNQVRSASGKVASGTSVERMMCQKAWEQALS